MTNNIYNTQVDKIQREVDGLVEDLTLGRCIEDLKVKYEYLHSTSNTLFTFIIKEHQKNDFNKDTLNKNLEPMLKQIILIQKKQLTQNDASENIGKLLARQYIPQYK